jgi:hypothetical protein
VADRRAGKFSLGMGQRLGIAAALLGDPGILLFDEPVNGLDPEGIRWVRHFLRGLAAEGRTVLVSSHLISEMSLTADRLVVIGRGRLIAETTVADFVARSGGGSVSLHSADLASFGPILESAGARVAPGEPGTATVEGLTAPAIGDLAAEHRVRVHELVPVTASLEDAFMALTHDEVEYRPTGRTDTTAAPVGGLGGMMDTHGTAAIPLAPGPGRYRFTDVVRSEVVKLTTLRSTAIGLGLTVVASLVVTALASHAAGSGGEAAHGFRGSTPPSRLSPG